MKKKNTKLDLIRIIPEILGSIGICIAACLHIPFVQVEVIGFMEFAFQMVLVILVVGVGLKGMSQGLGELKTDRWK